MDLSKLRMCSGHVNDVMLDLFFFELLLDERADRSKQAKSLACSSWRFQQSVPLFLQCFNHVPHVFYLNIVWLIRKVYLCITDDQFLLLLCQLIIHNEDVVKLYLLFYFAIAREFDFLIVLSQFLLLLCQDCPVFVLDFFLKCLCCCLQLCLAIALLFRLTSPLNILFEFSCLVLLNALICSKLRSFLLVLADAFGFNSRALNRNIGLAALLKLVACYRYFAKFTL